MKRAMWGRERETPEGGEEEGEKGARDKNLKTRTEDNGYHGRNLAWYTTNGMVSEKRSERRGGELKRGRKG